MLVFNKIITKTLADTKNYCTFVQAQAKNILKHRNNDKIN